MCGGWGDRLKGIMAAYGWSILTNRKLEINIKHPCDLINALDWNEIKWYKSDEELEMENKLGYNTTVINAVSQPKYRKMMKEIDLLSYYNDSDIIQLKVNYDWLRHMSTNKKLYNRMTELGIEPSKFRTSYLFRQVYNKLFKLKPHLEERYQQFLKIAKPKKDTKLICIQFRVFYAGRDNSKLFWDFVNQTYIQNLTSDYRIFITSEKDYIEEEAKQVFGKEKIVNIPGVFFEMDTSNDITPTNCTRIEKALLDFHAMQNCNMAIISKSGFGILGVANRDIPNENLYLFKPFHRLKFGGKFYKMDMHFDDYLI